MQISQDGAIFVGKVAEALKTLPSTQPHGDPDKPVGHYYIDEIKIVWYGDGVKEDVGFFKPDDFDGYDFWPVGE